MNSLQQGMKPITVPKAVLLEKLKTNKIKHIEEFKILQEAYNDKAITELTNLLELAKKRPETVKTSVRSLNQPISNEKEYEVVIGMFELAMEETFELDLAHYRRFILDEWDWTHSFAMSKTAYGID